MGLKNNIIGGIITIAIGGSVYTVSQPAIVDNFVKDTGMTQQEGEKYVEQTKDNLVSWDKIGDSFVEDGKIIIEAADEVDCANYTYEWESATLNCYDGRAELYEIGNNEIALGQAYIKLSLEESSKNDIPPVIELIDKVNRNYSSEIVSKILDPETIDDSKKTNSYNKATLQAVLQEN